MLNRVMAVLMCLFLAACAADGAGDRSAQTDSASEGELGDENFGGPLAGGY